MILAWLPGIGVVEPVSERTAYDVNAFRARFTEVRFCGYDTRIHPYIFQFTLAARLKDCDIVKADFTGSLPGVLAKRLYGTRLVVNYNYHALRIAEIHGKPAHVLWLRILRRLALRAADGVIVASRALEQEVLAAGYRGYRVVVPNGVDLERFRPSEQRWTAPVILTVGRDSPEKNLSVVREAVAQIKGAVLNEVRGLPYAQMPTAYQSASVFVLPSLTEGCSKSLLEAMASGLRCIATMAAAEGLAGGWDPLIIMENDSDPSQWASAIRHALKDPELGASSRAWVERHHDIRRTLFQEVAFLKWVGRR